MKNHPLLRLSVLIIFIFFFQSVIGWAQIFVPVNTGSIVNDGGHSFGHSWGDYNKDGWLDLMVNNPSIGQDNFFYQNNGDGTFTKNSSINIIKSGPSSSSTWADVNNDGWMDVFVANGGTASNNARNFLFLNNGDGTFNEVTTGALLTETSAHTTCSWVDVDQDGWLDLFVGKAATSNALFYNQGNGSFSKTSLPDNAGSWGVSWADYDNDGDMDTYMANYGIPNYLYENENGNLVRQFDGPTVMGSAMSLSVSWGDYDNDGWLDLFVGNSQGPDQLFHNEGGGVFSVVSNNPIVDANFNSEGSCWTDYDNDGDLDLIVSAGGNVSTGFIHLYENKGNGNFLKITNEAIANLNGRYEALTCVDYDNDGDMDLFASNYAGLNNQLFTNQGNTNHWLSLVATGTTSNRSAIGTRIRIKATINGEEVWQIREITAHTGHVGQSDFRPHIGLGDATVVDSLVLQWPSGLEEVYTNVLVDQFHEFTEGESLTSPTLSAPVVSNASRLSFFPNPFHQKLTIRYWIGESGEVDLSIFDIQGRQVVRLFQGEAKGGEHIVRWVADPIAGNKMPDGFYFLRLKAEDILITKALVLIND